ncbi:MAG: hypothetical protein ACP5KW_12120, partial [Thermoproteota archaeon]
MIHCLPPDSKILTEFGYYLPIKEFQKKKVRVLVFDKDKNSLVPACIKNFWKFKNTKKVLKIRTLTGLELTCTSDHPILTENGWKIAEELKKGDKVLVSPFEGVEYEEPKNLIILEEKHLKKVGATEGMIRNLKKKGLVPLKLTDEKIGIIARLVGYAFGDAWIGGKRPTVKFCDKPEVLEKIREDLKVLGFGSTLIKQKKRKITIQHVKGIIQSEGMGYHLVVTSPSFAIFLNALGVPRGKKTDTRFDIPDWIRESPKWIKRLFLAGYFGAEMNSASVRKNEPYRIEGLSVSLNKVEDLLEDGVKFMKSCRQLLKEFGIESAIFVFPYTRRKDGKISYKILLRLSTKLENMLRFLGKVGCEYHLEKLTKFIQCLHYYRYKKKIIETESEIAGKSFSSSLFTAYKFKEASLLPFTEFVEGLSAGKLVMWDIVEEIEEVKGNVDEVYDLTIDHPEHNFVANGFIVSNTGSRGLGHQVATDYLQIIEREHKDLLRKLPDRE